MNSCEVSWVTSFNASRDVTCLASEPTRSNSNMTLVRSKNSVEKFSSSAAFQVRRPNALWTAAIASKVITKNTNTTLVEASYHRFNNRLTALSHRVSDGAKSFSGKFIWHHIRRRCFPSRPKITRTPLALFSFRCQNCVFFSLFRIQWTFVYNPKTSFSVSIFCACCFFVVDV